MFIDIAKIKIVSGKGGDGKVGFHREKYVAAGGPDGGDGGRGGSVIFKVDDNLSTLLDFRYKKKYVAAPGEPGGGKRCKGKDGADLIIRVPRGTIIRDQKTGQVMKDMSDSEPFVAAKGGNGGWGNTHFATPTRQAPRFAKPGLPGVERDIILELKLLADVGLVGFPNVGKSTLINSLLGYQRSLVADEMGTTRDAVDSVWKFKGKTFVLVDTAGMRKKSKIDEPVEKYSVIRSIRAIDNCDVAIFILDAEDMLTEQDKKIIGYIHEAGKGLILFVNKWDTIEKGNTTNVEFEKEIRKGLPFASYAPVLFGSALTKQRIHRLGDMIYAVAEQASLRVPTAVLNDLLEDAKMVNPPPAHSGRVAKIYYMTQVGIRPPTFVMFVNDANLIHFSYVRFMENRLREAFSFEGTPIRIVIRSKKDGGDD